MSGFFFAAAAKAAAKKPYKRRLAYLESTGTQYIDTLYYPNPDTFLEFSCARPDPHPYGGNFFGVTEPGETTSIRYIFAANFGGASNTDKNVYLWNDKANAYGGTANSLSFSDATVPATCTFGRGSATFWGKSKNFITPTTHTFEHTMKMFCSTAVNNVASSFAVLRMYSFRIYGANDALVRDFIPVMDNSDVPCMYDRVSGALFYNGGSGTFNYGVSTE